MSFIRYGEKIYSPVISEGEADYLLGFEKLEAMRNIHYLKKNGYAVINDMEIPPTPVVLGLVEYPKQTMNYFKEITGSLYFVNAFEASKNLGNSRTGNVLLLGVLSGFIENIDPDVWIDAIKINVKEKFVDVNIKAFEAGRAWIRD